MQFFSPRKIALARPDMPLSGALAQRSNGIRFAQASICFQDKSLTFFPSEKR